MAKAKKHKYTPAQIKTHIKRIQKLVEQERSENKHENFSAITRDGIEKKFKRVNSPMITTQSWGLGVRGAEFYIGIGIYNPEPTFPVDVYVHTWVGSGNIDPVVGTFLSNVDTRFPRLTKPLVNEPPFVSSDGHFIKQFFNIEIPINIDKSFYLGNCCLMKFNWIDVGTYLDRSVFMIDIRM
jgi:hypothetical protein